MTPTTSLGICAESAKRMGGGRRARRRPLSSSYELGDEVSGPVDYRPVETVGAARAAALLAELL
jgi:hypothetical protein